MTATLILAFPNLEIDGYEETSPATEKYNCIAWAAALSNQWWWPDPLGAYFWPEGVERAVTIEAFFGALMTRGFQPCESGDFEAGFEKVALYSLDGKPSHAARQLSDGKWTSKLGKYVDITHALQGLEGPVYGRATHFLKRATSKE
jgi:hypothetical protein